MKRVQIITDGSCIGNPGPGGWACILRCGDEGRELSGSETQTTNNRMELTAAINGLKALRETCEVELVTDDEGGLLKTRVSVSALVAVPVDLESGSGNAELTLFLETAGDRVEFAALKFNGLTAPQASHLDSARVKDPGTEIQLCAQLLTIRSPNQSMTLQKRKRSVNRDAMNERILFLRSTMNYANISAWGSCFDHPQNGATLLRQSDSASQELSFEMTHAVIRARHAEGILVTGTPRRISKHAMVCLPRLHG